MMVSNTHGPVADSDRARPSCGGGDKDGAEGGDEGGEGGEGGEEGSGDSEEFPLPPSSDKASPGNDDCGGGGGGENGSQQPAQSQPSSSSSLHSSRPFRAPHVVARHPTLQLGVCGGSLGLKPASFLIVAAALLFSDEASSTPMTRSQTSRLESIVEVG